MIQPLINRQPQKQQRFGDDGHLLLGFGGVFFCLFIALWAVGIDIVLPSALFISALLGFLFASALVHNAHLCFGLQIVLAQLFELLPTDDALSNGANGEQSVATGQNKEVEEKRNSDHLLAHESTNYIAPPWERIRINAQLNQELEELFETLLDCYVSSWYTELISTDTAFLLEVRHLIRHSSAKLINRLISVDLHSLFINDLFPLVLAHVERICRLTNAICRHENRLEITQMPASLIEYKVLDHWSDDIHWAMRSSANCDAYMRTVADLLIRQFVDDIRIGGCFVDEEHAKILGTNGGTAISSTAAKWSCHSSRHFLRELLFSSVLVPAMDFVADPDTLNRLMLSKLNDDDYGGGGAEYSALAAVVPDEQESSRRNLSPVWQEPFLARFVEPYYTNMPDSLLGLKLNDLVENQYLTKLFEMYLRDLNGPTHLLDCFVQARDIHLRIQTLNSAKYGGNSENQGYQRESSEIRFDAWQFFSTFVHSNGPNRIPLDGRIEAEFSAVLELNGRLEGVQEADQPQQQQQKVFMLKPLEKVIEAIYQQAYQNLQYNYVIPFWQSENYLGYLCGAPPDVDELISGPSDDYLASRRVPTKIPEGSFSLAQFRKKLFNFITPTKDIPSSSASSLFHQSSFSSMTAIETLGGTFASAEVDLDCAGTIAMADLSRDMAKWSVTIDGVAQRRANQQTVYHIYSVSVERNDLPDECYTATKVPSRMPSTASAAEEVDEDFGDADNFQEEEEEEDLPKVWTVGHRCEEFFALEDRLREHCGNTFRLGNNSTLPDRKTTLQMLQNGRNNRALMETYRIHFERFLNQLLQQPSMKRSDLLYIFLTSEENSTGLFELAISGDSGGGGGGGWRSGTATNFLPDLNPIRAMRKVGGKERGQNLKPFILNLLANTLAPPMRQNSTPMMMQQQQRSSEQSYQSGDTTSIKSETATARSSDGGRRSASGCSNSKPCSISAYNFPDKSPNSSSSDDYRHRHSGFGTGNFYDLFLFFSLHLGLIARFPIWLEALLCSLRTFVGFLLSIVFRRKTEQILDDNLFNVQMAIYLVRSLHELILFQNVPSSSSSLHATPSQNSMASAAASGKQTTTADKQKMQRKPMTLVAGTTTTAKSAGAATKSPAISEQERKLRAELALHCLEKWVERTLPMSPFLRWVFGRFASVSSPCMTEDDRTEEEGERTDQNNQLETSVRQLFLCFQMSTLNRQLAFVLMDKLLQKIVIEKPQTADYGAEVNERSDDTGH